HVSSSYPHTIHLSIHAHYRDLPSFPTRRSSDLIRHFARGSRRLPVRKSVGMLINKLRCAGPILVLFFGYPLQSPAVKPAQIVVRDRKSTRLNSSHVSISYAVFCLKKKKVLRFSS